MYLGVPPYGSSLLSGTSMPPYDVPFFGGSAYHYNYGSRLSAGTPKGGFRQSLLVVAMVYLEYTIRAGKVMDMLGPSLWDVWNNNSHTRTGDVDRDGCRRQRRINTSMYMPKHILMMLFSKK